MKTSIVVISAAVILAACNEGRQAATNAQASPKTEWLCGDCETFDLRMLGVNAGGMTHATAALVGIRDLRVEGPPGTHLEIEDSSLDLAQTDHAWLLGRVTVPPGTTDVHVVIVFDDFGGLEWGGEYTGAASIRARGAEVRFTAPIDWLRMNGHAVVEMDIAASVFGMRAGEKLLLPVLAVHY